VMWTPQPAGPLGRADPSVKMCSVGSRGLGHAGLGFCPQREPLDISMDADG